MTTHRCEAARSTRTPRSWSWIMIRSRPAGFDDMTPASVRPRDLAVLALGAVYVERFSECFTGNITRTGNAG